MHLAVALGVVLGLAGQAVAQQPIPAPPAETEMVLRLAPSQVQMIAQTLSAIGCQNVQQWVLCRDAVALLEDIKKQAREQSK